MMDSSAVNKGAANKGASLFKVALTAGAGATIEWYDFFVYGTAAALVFPKIFFAADLPPLVAQLAAFSTFAVGFIARPFGGIVFGHFGDLFGRKKALLVALLTMGLATTAIGFLPTYTSVGALSPLLLLALRFVQGIAVGGQ
ncbi:sugar transport protein [Nitrospirillum amazonense]|uniref:Sugar transport protein n=1 Tax=Nitrospirillum amazonense TaxID=28077 RepID=A0A560F0R7_9PROT|nr:sugar transport protein [Nitrospirillum amazonense]